MRKPYWLLIKKHFLFGHECPHCQSLFMMPTSKNGILFCPACGMSILKKINKRHVNEPIRVLNYTTIMNILFYGIGLFYIVYANEVHFTINIIGTFFLIYIIFFKSTHGYATGVDHISSVEPNSPMFVSAPFGFYVFNHASANTKGGCPQCTSQRIVIKALKEKPYPLSLSFNDMDYLLPIKYKGFSPLHYACLHCNADLILVKPTNIYLKHLLNLGSMMIGLMLFLLLFIQQHFLNMTLWWILFILLMASLISLMVISNSVTDHKSNNYHLAKSQE